MTTPRVITTTEGLAAFRAEDQTPIALVPTMGALHDGHLSLVRAAAAPGDARVVVSIFVNPLQFAPGEDLDAYPRTLDRDLERLEGEGVDAVFAPTEDEMYPAGKRTTIHPGPTGQVLEGESRPTHFAGVLTVVYRLFRVTGARRAYFGQKDYQQLVLVRQMVEDLGLGVEVHGEPIVREGDGLALSSRNVYLDPSQRRAAAAIPAAIDAATTAAPRGRQAALDAAAEALVAEPTVEVDYISVRGADLGEPPSSGEARVLIAARVGTTRLIDNSPIDLG